MSARCITSGSNQQKWQPLGVERMGTRQADARLERGDCTHCLEKMNSSEESLVLFSETKSENTVNLTRKHIDDDDDDLLFVLAETTNSLPLYTHLGTLQIYLPKLGSNSCPEGASLLGDLMPADHDLPRLVRHR